MTNVKFIKQIICYGVIILLCSTAKIYSQEDATQSKNSSGLFLNAYIYPASLLVSALVASLNEDDEDDDNYKPEKTEEDDSYFTNIYLTFELGINKAYSCFITPSYQGWNYTASGYKEKGGLNHDRLGGDFGLRFYLSGDQNFNGFFIQATGGIYYFSRAITYEEDPIKKASYKAVLYQGMGYLGYKWEDIYLSIGAGYNHYKDKKLSYRYKEERRELREDMAFRGFVFDVAIAIRIPVIK